jgi:predicted nucleic acid-binding protein
MSDRRTLLVDASVFITLGEVDETDLMYGLEGRVVVPAAVRAEVTQDPAASELEAAIDRDDVTVLDTAEATAELDAATDHLGRSAADEETDGDVALLARALDRADPVVLTDDKPLRTACKALSIPVSGTIGVLIRAVERGAIGPETAKERLVAMDQVGARLSASLLRRAERLIDGAADR